MGRYAAIFSVLAMLVSACGTDAPPTPLPARTSNSPTAQTAAFQPEVTAEPTGTSQPAATAEPVFEPVAPGSLGLATLHHTLIATSVDFDSGVLLNEGAAFPSQTRVLGFFLAWDSAPEGTKLGIRILSGEEVLYEAPPHSVVRGQPATAGNAVGFVMLVEGTPYWSDGTYQLDTMYNDRVDETQFFSIGDGELPPPILGTGEDSGPIPYKDPAEVLVVTRESVLRNLMSDADVDAVLDAAASVGDLRDLDEGGVVRDTPEVAGEFVKDLLRAGGYRYLLILGNDDAVPFFRMTNPYGDQEEEGLEGSGLPADWLPSDDPYADLIEDPYQTPDLGVARIPSSEDAELLLTQLGTNTPPDGHGYALLNQKRRSQGSAVVAEMTRGSAVEVQYSPPVKAGDFLNGNGNTSRYLYVLLHGIGTNTDQWTADAEEWHPFATSEDEFFVNEWTVLTDAHSPGLTLEDNPGSTGLVSVGACYGAWTLDTVATEFVDATHKTAENNLALHYLKSGARAFVADTHLSYSYRLGLSTIRAGRTGFEMAYWNAVSSGQAPIDAFLTAKRATAAAIDELIEAEVPTAALITHKTLHYMVYFGRP